MKNINEYETDMENLRFLTIVDKKRRMTHSHTYAGGRPFISKLKKKSIIFSICLSFKNPKDLKLRKTN